MHSCSRLRVLPIFLVACVLLVVAGCQEDNNAAPPSNEALGLNRQQARGREIYDRYCLQCHYAYREGGVRGPSLKGLYKQPYMPSGAPANDERVSDAILMGRSKMPAYDRVLSQQQLADLLAYLHTL